MIFVSDKEERFAGKTEETNADIQYLDIVLIHNDLCL